MSNSTNTNRMILSLIFLNFSRMSAGSKMKYVQKNMVINYGIIWETFNPLILVYGLTYLFASGIRGGGLFDPDFFVFIFLFWINFTKIVQSTIAIRFDDSFLKEKDFGNLFLVSIASVLTSMLQAAARFVFTILLMQLLGFEIKLLSLLIGFYSICFYGILLGYIIKFIIEDSKVFQNIVNFGLSLMFFASNVIFPIEIFPENIKYYLLYNPIVHINEFLRTSYLGTFSEFIDLSYCTFIFIPLLMASTLITILKLELIFPKS